MIRTLLDDDCTRLCMPGNYPGYIFSCVDSGNYTTIMGVYDGSSIGHPERNGYRMLVQSNPGFVPHWPPGGTAVPRYWDLHLPQPAPIGGVYEHLFTPQSEYESPYNQYAPYRARTDPSRPNPLTAMLIWRNNRGGYGDPNGDWDEEPLFTIDSSYFWGTGNFAEGRDNSSFLADYVSYGYFNPMLSDDAVRALWFYADLRSEIGLDLHLTHFVSSWRLGTPVLSNHTIIGCANDTSGDALSGVWAVGTRKAQHHDLDPDRVAAWAGCIFAPGIGLPGNHLLDLDEAVGYYESALNHCYFAPQGSILAVGWKREAEDNDKSPLLMYYTPDAGWTDQSAILPAWDFATTGPRDLDLVHVTQVGFASGGFDFAKFLITGWIAAPDCAGPGRRPIAWTVRESEGFVLDHVFWAGIDHGDVVLPYTDAAMLCAGSDIAAGGGSSSIMAAGASCGHWATFLSAGIEFTYGDAQGWYAGIVQV